MPEFHHLPVSLTLATSLLASAAYAAGGGGGEPGVIDIRDPIVQHWFEATPHNPPALPEPGRDYGLIGEGGAFVAPEAAPLSS